MLETPIALIVFNRPDTTRRVFEAIRLARPQRLFVIADAPRPDRDEEAERCAEALRVATAVDWDCQLEVDIATRNLGCRQRVSTGLDRVFATVERAIVLEDDCVPSPSFFRFCEELLERYADDLRVMAVSGDNYQFGADSGPDSYYFSRFNHVWGWATWRRAWALNDAQMRAWPSARAQQFLARTIERRSVAWYFARHFERVWRGDLDSWAFAWTFACWWHGGLTALPGKNLVRNIGFGAGATHTLARHPAETLEAAELEFPLRHPVGVVRNAEADRRTEDQVFLWRRPVRLAARFIDAASTLSEWMRS